MNYNWKEKVVLITGASSGIGESLAVECARRGAAVGLIARRGEILQEIVNRIHESGGRATLAVADVASTDQVDNAVKLVEEEYGRIDTLIANAGISAELGTTAFNVEEFTRVIDTNLLGVVRTVSAVIGNMQKRRSGHIVGISSLAAYRGLPKSAAYCASKAGVSAFFDSLRLDLAGTGIAVTTIHPGFIRTPLTAGREAHMPFLMELPEATGKILRAIEEKRRLYSFPWQLATIVKSGRLMPAALYDQIASRNSFRE
jgi:short-subunit dehydrogenase